MAYLAEDQQVWLARVTGAAAGASLSLIYMLPRGRREAATRFTSGLLAGLLFGGPAGIYLAGKLALMEALSGSDIVLSGSAAVSLCAWWVLGALKRMADKWGQ